jgi:hypothetical protein
MSHLFRVIGTVAVLAALAASTPARATPTLVAQPAHGAGTCLSCRLAGTRPKQSVHRLNRSRAFRFSDRDLAVRRQLPGRFNSGHRKLGLPAADSRLPDRNRHRRCPNHPTKQLGAKVGMFGSRVACRREQADGLLGAGVHPACGEPEIAGRARGFLWGV